MRTSHTLTHALLALLALVVMASAARAADPGLRYPATSEISDQKAGSVLIYNIYTSNPVNLAGQDTTINITNTNTETTAYVHLFLVDGVSCSPTDLFICLTQNQTSTFFMSDLDPGVTGYLVAIAVDGVTGCPINFNFLIGSEYVKFSTGHQARLGAEAIAALYGTTQADPLGTGATLPGCDRNSVTANLTFDGVFYNQLPRVLAIDSIPARGDGNDTLVIINRIGGNLAIGAATLGNIAGVLYDDLEHGYSFTFNGGLCQFRAALSNNFPRTSPRFETVIPIGRTGWMKLFNAQADIGILGAMINFNPNASANAFNGGSNLHKLTLATSAMYTIPIFAPSCGLL